jgi:hypothetical protein
MKTFYFIPHREIVNHSDQVFAQLMQLEGCEFALDREGIIITPNSKAHVRACLLNIELLKGLWQDPVDV